METTQKVYDQQAYIFRDDYRTDREYRAAYADLAQHYGYKAQVEGGWLFFENLGDLETWKAQR